MANIITEKPDEWFDDVFAHCPGVGFQLVRQTYRRVIREFCKQSAAWQVELWDADGDDKRPWNLGPTQLNYDFQAAIETQRASAGPNYVSGDSATAQVNEHRLIDYWAWDILYITHVLYIRDFPQADGVHRSYKVTRFVYPDQKPYAGAPSSSYQSETGAPRKFLTYNERPGVIQLQPNMTSSDHFVEGIVPVAAMGFTKNVSDANEDIPKIFCCQWYEHILDGIVSKLMSMQDKPWTNPIMAQYHARRFRNGIAEARDVARRQANMSNDSWRFPAWA